MKERKFIEIDAHLTLSAIGIFEIGKDISKENADKLFAIETDEIDFYSEEGQIINNLLEKYDIPESNLFHLNIELVNSDQL